MFLSKISHVRDWVSLIKSEVKGSMAVEGALLLPFFVLIYLSATTFFQVQRVDSSYLHAATTLGDLVTRQIVITDQTADNFYATGDRLVASNDNFNVVITSVSYNAAQDEYFVNWSSSNIPGSEFQDQDIVGYEFPAMEVSESVMLVTVSGSVTPLVQGFFNSEVDFFKHTIRRPRFVRLVARS